MAADLLAILLLVKDLNLLLGHFVALLPNLPLELTVLDPQQLE